MSVQCYSVGEEIANAVTHGLGVAAAIVTLTLMLNKGLATLEGIEIFAISLYGTTLIVMFLSSTLYHAIAHQSVKRVFKQLDHCAIYLLIAGSYTPLMMISLDSALAFWLLLTIWLLAAAGIVFKVFFTGRFKLISTMTYLLMGWASLLVINELYHSLPLKGFYLLLAGGLSYSLGTLFYAAKRWRYSHAIWHIFVLLGAGCHAALIGLFIIP